MCICIVFVCLLLDTMASNDMDVGIEGYLFEPEKADYPNINQSGSDSELSSDTEGESVHNFRDGRAKMSAKTWCQCGQCVKQKTDDKCNISAFNITGQRHSKVMFSFIFPLIIGATPSLAFCHTLSLCTVAK